MKNSQGVVIIIIMMIIIIIIIIIIVIIAIPRILISKFSGIYDLKYSVYVFLMKFTTVD